MKCNVCRIENERQEKKRQDYREKEPLPQREAALIFLKFNSRIGSTSQRRRGTSQRLRKTLQRRRKNS